MTRRSRSGQAIIIIAFAFIALIAFVGIATDVALLFVRYSTLRRAVDAAAIAAAGQVREGTNYLTLNGVAMQFIQIHGLNPRTVKVETCETEVVKYLGGTGPYDQATVQGALNALYATSELCKRNPQKLVRVTAQVESPTAFLGIIGWRNVTLETSAISQTAALDVAIVLDTSLSQALVTRDREAEGCLRGGGATPEQQLMAFKDFTNVGAAYNGGAPPTLPSAPQKWGLGLSPSTGSTTDGVGNLNVRHECWYTPSDPNPQKKANYGWAGCCNDPTTQSDAPGGVVNAAIVGTDPYRPAGMTNFNTDAEWYVTDRSDLAESTINTNGTNPLTNTAAAQVVSGSKDGNRSDLICQPFKQVRDAARRFIKALDFVRGDRVVLVTFDSNAKAIKPWKTDGTEGIEIFTEKSTAIRALNMQVGVEVNENSMQYGCHSLGNIYDSIIPPSPPDPNYPTNPKYYPDVNPKGIISYWTMSQCPATNTGGGILAASNALVNPDWVRREAVWVMVILSDGYPNRTPAQGTGGVYSADRDWLRVLPGTPGVDMPANNGTDNAFLWQYCSKTLRNLSTGVEIDNICNPDNTSCPPLPGPDGYPDPNPDWGLLYPQMCASSQFAPTYGPKAWGLTSPSSNAGSGSFGFCPWWTFCQLNPGDYTRLSQCTEAAPRGVWQDPANAAQRDPGDLPTCADPDPDSRHFCMDGSGKINPAAGDNPNPAGYTCDPHYDADDYARDRVDFAALINYIDKPPTSLNNGKPLRGNFIAMYSIYFQHVAPGASTDVKENILGVKFLRYVADAGDNGKIDNRLQRWYRDERDKQFRTPFPLPPTGRNEGTAPGGTTSDQPYVVGGGRGVTTKGLSGQPIANTYDSADPWFDANLVKPPATTEDPCSELDFQVTGNLPAPAGTAAQYETDAKTDCGQFFFADSPTKVEKAFIEIASRLFTRLSR
jgi:Flp pilus assembly protein TadG